MAAGGPVDPTSPLPDGERRGAPQPSAGGEPTATGGLPGAYDPTIAVPPVGPPEDPYGPPPSDGEGDNRKWLWGLLAALGVIVLGVIIALLLSGGDDDGNKPTASSTSSSTSTSTSTSTTSTTVTTVPGAPVITAYSSNPATTVSCPNTTSVIQVTLTWTTTNATGVTLTVDGGSTASFGPSGSAVRDFNCGQATHAYTLTALGANNANATRTINLGRQLPTPTTTTTAPPPPSTTTTTKP